MELKKLDLNFTVSKISDTSEVDFTKEFVFLSKTDEEISLVCEADFTPSNAYASETDWKALKISGVLDFSMVGVIAKISNILSNAEISIFVISTYNTDYILLKAAQFEKSVQLLKDNGYIIN